MKWEYKKVFLVEGAVTLSEMGELGWELCAVTENPPRLPLAYFKRPVVGPVSMVELTRRAPAHTPTGYS